MIEIWNLKTAVLLTVTYSFKFSKCIAKNKKKLQAITKFLQFIYLAHYACISTWNLIYLIWLLNILWTFPTLYIHYQIKIFMFCKSYSVYLFSRNNNILWKFWNNFPQLKQALLCVGKQLQHGNESVQKHRVLQLPLGCDTWGTAQHIPCMLHLLLAAVTT